MLSESGEILGVRIGEDEAEASRKCSTDDGAAPPRKRDGVGQLVNKGNGTLLCRVGRGAHGPLHTRLAAVECTNQPDIILQSHCSVRPSFSGCEWRLFGLNSRQHEAANH